MTGEHFSGIQFVDLRSILSEWLISIKLFYRIALGILSNQID